MIIMKNVLLLGWFLSSCFCSAQLTFGEHIIADDSILPKGVTHVQMADINGDGDNDMITASADDNKIAWFENENGLGDFGTQNVISLEVEDAQYAWPADLDGDGDIDIIGVSRSDDKIVGFFNDGEGNFNMEIIISSNSQSNILPLNTIPADMDADGKVDLVVLSMTEELIYYRNLDNEGNYSKSLISELEVRSNSEIEIGDVDHDGVLDVVTHTGLIPVLTWHENTGSDFENILIDHNGLIDFQKLGDIDNDGDLDLMIIEQLAFGISRLSWLEFDNGYNNKVLLTENISNITVVRVVDINQDGQNDLVIHSPEISEILWFENAVEDGVANARWIINATSYIPTLVFKDFNGDGFLDLIAGDLKSYSYIPNGDQFDTYSEGRRLETFTDEAYDVLTLDIDNDGDLDVLSASNRDGRIGWFENTDGLGGYSKMQNLITKDVQGVVDIHLADLDGDNDLDIIGCMFFQSTVFWIRNEGGAMFSDTIVIDDNVSRANSVDVGDIDGDGDMDIVVAAIGTGFSTSTLMDNEIVWYRNENQLGDFSPPLLVLENDNKPTIVKLADIDMDQDLDVVCSLRDGGIKWIENSDGFGNFVDAVLISEEGESITQLEVGDIDLDGDVDILASNYFDMPTTLYLNDNGGELSPGLAISDLSSSSMRIVDLDEDGDMDIVATAIANFTMDVRWYEQSNDELTFTTHVISESPVLDGNNVDIADLDNDGDLDVMSASISDDKIAWYENYDPVSTNNIELFNFNISPVPASSHLRIDSEKILKQVMIFDIEGKLQLVSNEVTNLDISDLSRGMYFIQVMNAESETSTLRFVKH